MKLGTGYIDGTRKFIIRDSEWKFFDGKLSNDLLLNYEKREMKEFTGNLKFSVPVPTVENLRDFYAFENHVKSARKKRGLEMDETWYQFPAFYYQNRTNIVETGKDVYYPAFSKKIDFEVEIAMVIGKPGANIDKSRAFDHLIGFFLANDWSARDIQEKEMKIGLGPAKSKDFGTTLGPYITTTDELNDKIEKGKIFINVEVSLNGKKIKKIDTTDMFWGIDDMIARASQNCELVTGDVIMTGTLSGGSLIEDDEPIFLQRGDTVKIASPELGTIENRVV